MRDANFLAVSTKMVSSSSPSVSLSSRPAGNKPIFRYSSPSRSSTVRSPGSSVEDTTPAGLWSIRYTGTWAGMAAPSPRQQPSLWYTRREDDHGTTPFCEFSATEYVRRGGNMMTAGRPRERGAEHGTAGQAAGGHRQVEPAVLAFALTLGGRAVAASAEVKNIKDNDDRLAYRGSCRRRIGSGRPPPGFCR